MIWLDLFIAYCLIVAVNGIGLAALSYYFRRTQWTVPFLFLMLLITVWSATYVFEIRSHDFEVKLFWYNLRQSAIALMPAFWLFVALELIYPKQPLSLIHKMLLVIIPMITVTLAWTSAYHTLLRESVFLSELMGITLVKTVRGQWFWLSTIYALLINTSSLFLLWQHSRRINRSQRKPIYTFLVVMMAPFVLSFLDALGASTLLPFSLMLLSIAPVQLILGWVFFGPALFKANVIGYDILFGKMEDGVIVVDTHGRIAEINPAAARFFGLESSESIEGENINTLVKAWPLWQQGFTTQEPTRFEIESGSSIYDVQTTPLFSPTSEHLGYLSTLRDVTRLVEYQRRVSASEAQFRLIVDFMPAPVVLTHVQDGRVIYVNPKAEELFGVGHADVFNRPAPDFYTNPEDRARLVERIIQDGYAIIEDMSLKRADGETFWAIISSVQTEYAGAQVLVTAINDITARKTMEERLRRSEELYRSIVNASPDGILITNGVGVIQMISPAMARILGYEDPNEFVGQRIVTHIFPDDMDVARAAFRQFLEKGRLGTQTVRLLHRDGHKVPVEVNGELIYHDDGTPNATVIIVRDIIERLAIERAAFETRLQREKIVVLGRLIQDASHDLRTPITIVQTAAYLQQRMSGRIRDLLNGSSTPDRTAIYELLDKIVQRAETSEASAKRLGQIVDSMVEITRLESRTTLELRPDHLNPIVEAILAEAVPRFAAKPLVLEWMLAPLPPLALDSVELRIAVEHLLDNAYHYTPEGGSVTVRTFLRDDHAVIEVRDTGIGIAPHDITQVFESFFRADPARSANTGGTGLGLPIARRICEMHGGTLTVESTLGQGAVFTITLPLS